MNPALKLIFETQKLNDNDRYMAEAMPLLRKRLMLEGKADNAEIDNLYEQIYRLNAIGCMHKNQPLIDISLEANQALTAACDVACDQRKRSIAPSTDQKRSIERAMDALARLAGTITNKTYLHACIHAAMALAESKQRMAA